MLLNIKERKLKIKLDSNEGIVLGELTDEYMARISTARETDVRNVLLYNALDGFRAKLIAKMSAAMIKKQNSFELKVDVFAVVAIANSLMNCKYGTVLNEFFAKIHKEYYEVNHVIKP